MGVNERLDRRFELGNAAERAATDCFIVSSANQRSTRLIHELYVGVKCTWKRGRLANQFRISGVLWVL